MLVQLLIFFLSPRQIPSFEFLCEKLQMYQRQYNECIRGSFLDLVFFRDAMTHLIKVWGLLLFY